MTIYPLLFFVESLADSCDAIDLTLSTHASGCPCTITKLLHDLTFDFTLLSCCNSFYDLFGSTLDFACFGVAHDCASSMCTHELIVRMDK